MFIFGWIVATSATIGLLASTGLEIAYCEPVFLLLAKISAGIVGIGGLMVGIYSRRRI